jgi:fibronectin type 3 domain-containing protein
VDGQIYYYVVTSVDATGDESAYSEDVQMNIP